MPWIISGIIVSYFLGSIPTAYLFGRVLKGIDIRKFGSGNIGATNALRVLGRPTGIIVLILDILKGFLAVTVWGDFILSRSAYLPAESLLIVFGLACICGHIWTVFLRFKGGKGVAATFGVLLGLGIKIAGLKLIVGLAILSWLIVFISTRIVSLASVVTAVTLPLYMVLFKQSYALVLLSVILSAFIILRHRANLKRIYHKEEKKLF